MAFVNVRDSCGSTRLKSASCNSDMEGSEGTATQPMPPGSIMTPDSPSRYANPVAAKSAMNTAGQRVNVISPTSYTSVAPATQGADAIKPRLIVPNMIPRPSCKPANTD